MMLTTTASYVILFCVLICVPQITAAPFIDQEIDQSQLTTSSSTTSSTMTSRTTTSRTTTSGSMTLSTTISQSCPDVMINGEVYKKYWDDEEKRCHTCPKCTAGFELNKPCGNGEGAGAECVECGPETFSPDNSYDKCEPCAICENVMFNLRECTTKTDRICGPCKPGYEKDIYGNCELCTNCKPPITCGPDSFLTVHGECEPCAICENVQYNRQECTQTTDRICGPCKAGYAEDINGNCELCANFPPGSQKDCEQTTTTTLLTTTVQTTDAKKTQKLTSKPTTQIMATTHHQLIKYGDKYAMPSKPPNGPPYSRENEPDLEVSPVSQRGQVWPIRVFGIIAIVLAILFMGFLGLFLRPTRLQLMMSICGSKSMSFEDEKKPEDKTSNPGSKEEKEVIKVNIEAQTTTFINTEYKHEDIKLKAEKATLHDNNKRQEAKINVSETDNKDGQAKNQRGRVASFLRVPAQIKRTMSRESESDSGDEGQRLITDSMTELDNDVFVDGVPTETSVLLSASPESPTTLTRNTPNIPETSVPLSVSPESPTTLTRNTPNIPVTSVPLSASPESQTTLTRNTPNIPEISVPLSVSPESPTTLTRNTPNIHVSLKEAGVNGYEGKVDKDRNDTQQMEWQRKYDRALELSEGKPITDILNDETVKFDLVSMLTPPPPTSYSTTQPIKDYTNMLSSIGVEYKHRNRFKEPEDVLNYMHKSMAGSRDMKRLLEEVRKIDRLDITEHVRDFIFKRYEKNE